MNNEALNQLNTLKDAAKLLDENLKDALLHVYDDKKIMLADLKLYHAMKESLTTEFNNLMHTYIDALLPIADVLRTLNRIDKNYQLLKASVFLRDNPSLVDKTLQTIHYSYEDQ